MITRQQTRDAIAQAVPGLDTEALEDATQAAYVAMLKVDARNARTDGVDAVLDFVRDTGKSAHPQRGEHIGHATMHVAVLRHLNPVQLQAEVDRYADAMDTLAMAGPERRR